MAHQNRDTVRSLYTIPFFLLAAALHGQGVLTAFISVQNATCGSTTGSAIATVFGGVPPYTYLWTPAPPTGQGTLSLTNLPPGTYTLAVEDAQGTSVTREITVVLTPDLFPPVVETTPAWSCDPGCNGSYYEFIPLPGGTTYTVAISPPGASGTASPNGLSLSSLCPGENYTVTVTNSNGCSGTVSGLEVVGPMNPQIVDSSVQASCPGGSNGSFVVEFTEADQLVISVPGIQQWQQAGNTVTALNVPAGTYAVVVSASASTGQPPGTSGPQCTVTFAIVVPESGDPCGTVSGVVHADLDTDCVQDAGEVGLPFRVLAIQPGDQAVLTDADGAYSTALFHDAYTLDADPAGYATSCISLPAPFTLDASNTAATIDLPMAPLDGPDAGVFLTAGVHRPGFPVTYTVLVQNNGPFPLGPMSTGLAYDPLLVFVSASGVPAGTSAGQVNWDISGLAPFAILAFTVELTVPPNAALIGTIVSATATIGAGGPDGDATNDSYSISRTIVGAYDPNDKLARTSSGLGDQWYFLNLDTYIDYTIRFQNTGTAEAINVHLLDTLSPLLDLFSLQILGASHAFTAELLPGRVLRFDFPGIMLPDSTTDLAGSQGFASFRIKPVPGLGLLVDIPNAADIFFDFNEPIRTNTASLTTDITVGLAERSDALALHPNPVDQLLMASLPPGSMQAEVVAMDGRVVLFHPVRDTQLRLPVAALTPGAYVLRVTGTDGSLRQQRFVKD